jgi:hypothetical protein
METCTRARTEIAAPRHTVLRFASDPVLLAEWNNDYTGCALKRAECREDTIVFGGTTRRGDTATWTLTLNDLDNGTIEVIADVEEVIDLRYPRLRGRLPAERKRKARIDQGLERMKGFAETVARRGDSRLEPGDMVALLNVYTTQFGSYTSLLWQVPTIGLTAQAFLMTIILGAGGHHARYLASALSIVIAYASVHLMHDQRARAINHAELAKRISYRLSLTHMIGGSFGINDAVPHQGTDAQNVWATNRVIYGVWIGCMLIFAAIDALVTISLLSGSSWISR